MEEIPKGVLAHAYGEASKYLAAQMDVAKASDQRAITAASIFGAAAAAIFGFCISQPHVGAALALAASAFTLLVAAGFCAHAAMPVDMHCPGNVPSSWSGTEYESAEQSMADELPNMQTAIDHNDKCLRSNAGYIRFGMRSAIAAPLAGVIVWFLANVSS